MSYIQELRKLIGNRSLVVAGAAALIFDEKGRLLMVRRSDNKLWGVITGVVDPGESVEETAKREAAEEVGIVVEKLKFFSVFSGERQHYIYPNGNEIYTVTTAFIVENYSGVPRVNDDESVEIRFFDLDALPKEITPTNQAIVEKLVAERIPLSISCQ